MARPSSKSGVDRSLRPVLLQGGIYAWPGKPQGRYGQPHDSWGWCVPVEHLEGAVGARRTQVRQMCLLATAAPQ